jgi:hypothetical protein
MSGRKKLGLGLAIFGALNILDFFSPIPIPTVGVEAFLVGAVFIGGGALLMGLDRLSALRLGELFRARRAIGSGPAPRMDPLLPVRVLQFAKDKGGKLTVSEVAMSLQISLDAAEAALTELLKRGDARADVSLSTGVTTYKFPEFLGEALEDGEAAPIP